MTRIPTTELDHSLRAFYERLLGAPSILNDDATLVSGAVAVSIDITAYQTTITSGGTDSGEDVNIGDGTGAIVGQRKLITLGTRTSASDVINLDHANCVAADGSTALTNLDLDAAGEFVLLEWNGTKWQIIYANATVAT